MDRGVESTPRSGEKAVQGWKWEDFKEFMF